MGANHTKLPEFKEAKRKIAVIKEIMDKYKYDIYHYESYENKKIVKRIYLRQMRERVNSFYTYLESDKVQRNLHPIYIKDFYMEMDEILEGHRRIERI